LRTSHWLLGFRYYLVRRVLITDTGSMKQRPIRCLLCEITISRSAMRFPPFLAPFQLEDDEIIPASAFQHFTVLGDITL